MSKRHKIIFKIEQDEDDYPPVASEGIWAERMDSGLYKIDGIPFFTGEATHEDLIEVEEEDGVLYFSNLVKKSENSLVRIVCFEGVDPQKVRADIANLGCSSEFAANYNLISVNVPSSKLFKEFQKFLKKESKKGVLDYEEAIIRP